jgi:hypothetical protein
MRNAYKVVSGKNDDKRLLGRPRYRSKDTVEMGHKTIELGLNYGSAYGPVAGSCEHGSEPSGSIKDGKFLGHLRDKGRSLKLATHLRLIPSIVRVASLYVQSPYASSWRGA